MAEHHGMYGTRTYKSWSEMKFRCDHKNHSSSKAYDNISYCNEWKNFRNFFRDMGERPIGTSIDRIDGKNGYYKENCRWATDEQQQNNKSSNKKYLIDGEFLTLPQISRKFNISRSNLSNKIYIKKWDIYKSIKYLVEKGGGCYR